MNLRRATTALFGLSAVLWAALPSQAQTPNVPSAPATKGPSVALALEAAQTAISLCDANGYKVSVSIVDSAGVLKALAADDGARQATVGSSTRKAVTALTFKEPTSALVEQAKADPALAARIAADPAFSLWPGGLPLMAGNEIIGAIGVGGATGGDKDEACAQAALEKIKSRLM